MERDCIFCQIVSGEKSADFLYQDQSIVVFKDIYPHAPVHLLIVPRRHIRSINEVTEQDKGIISQAVFKGKEMAKEQGIAKSGYKLFLMWSKVVAR